MIHHHIKLLVSFLFTSLCCLTLSATTVANADSVPSRKSGFTFGVLPAIAYDSDLGLQTGALTNLYWYGDDYPRYRHSLYLEASRFRAGTTLLRTYYDSPELIKSFRTTIDVTWFNDLTMDFYGFNGRESIFNVDFEDEDSPDYATRVFYKHRREMFRVMFNIKHKIGGHPNWQWIAGATLFNMDISPVDIDHLNKKNDKPLPDTPGLYEKFCDWGVIAEDERDGGFNTYLKAGIGYDSRDRESFATSGMWSEFLLAYAPSVLGSNDKEYCKLTFYHRQYFNIWNRNLVFAYRVGFQHKLWGETPFYLLPHWNTTVMTSATSQGLGGGKTMRGIRRNRIVGDGSAMVNAELRYVFSRFRVGKSTVSIGSNIFTDSGIVTRRYNVDTSNVPAGEKDKYFSDKGDKPHFSVGAGIKAALNENFILSVENGYALDKNDGDSGLYVTMNYLF
jgi:outer membrane protein assembly factor BamA